jgi:bifunctional non-homologous end joining protein LigD
VSGGVEVEIGGRRLSLSNLDKPMYPSGFTKAQVIDYYTRVAPAMLPHLVERPITLKRYPNGSQGMFFYEKRCPAHRPRWIETERIVVKVGAIDFCIIEDVAALAWLGNIACLEIHAYLYKRGAPTVPTMMVFDLDPGAPAGLVDSARIALELKALLAAQGLESLVKFSGSKGLHVYVPLNHPRLSFERTKAYARAAAMALERRLPERVTSVMAKSERGGKVFIDWSQNDFAKTTCCVYSLRAQATPRVSAPVSWAEVERAASSGDAARLISEAPAVLEAVRRHGDAFATLETLRQRLPDSEPEARGPRTTIPAPRRARPSPRAPAKRGSGRREP